MSGSEFLHYGPCRKKGKFRLVEIDPCIINVKTAPQDCLTVLLYCIEYGIDGKDANGKPNRTYYREEISRIGPTEEDAFGYEDMDASGLDSDDTCSIQHLTRQISSGMAP